MLEVDLTNNAKAYPRILRRGARVVVYGSSGPEALLPSVALMQKSIGLQFFMIYDIPARDRQECLSELGHLLDGNRLRHTIALSLSLEQTAQAHELLEQGEVIGNVVLAVA